MKFRTLFGLTACLFFASFSTAWACSLASPSVTIKCTGQEDYGQYLDTYNKTTGEAIKEITTVCPTFSLADDNEQVDQFDIIFSDWQTGVQADFWQYTALQVEPYSAEREAERLTEYNECHAIQTEQIGDWLLSYGERQPFCKVNPGDGASCPFLELDSSALKTYCEDNPNDSETCSVLAEIDRQWTRWLAVVPVVFFGGAIVFVISRIRRDL